MSLSLPVFRSFLSSYFRAFWSTQVMPGKKGKIEAKTLQAFDYDNEGKKEFCDAEGKLYQDGLFMTYTTDDNKVREGVFVTNVKLVGLNNLKLGPQRSIQTREEDIWPAPGLFIQFPVGWRKLGAVQFKRGQKRHIIVVRLLDTTGNGEGDTEFLELMDMKFMLSLHRSLCLPEHSRSYEKEIMPMFLPFLGGPTDPPTEPPVLRKYRERDILLAQAANKAKREGQKAAGYDPLRISGRKRKTPQKFTPDAFITPGAEGESESEDEALIEKKQKKKPKKN
eukprot:g58881.t1